MSCFGRLAREAMVKCWLWRAGSRLLSKPKAEATGLAERVAAQQQAEITFTAHQAGLNARRETLREGLLFRIPALYGGPSQ